MAEGEHIKQPREEERPVDAPDVPVEEGVERADVADQVDRDPDEQLSRPDQPGFDEAERRQYQDPQLERAIADDDRPEDR